MKSEAQLRAMEPYLDRVRGSVESLRDFLSAEECAEVEHLIHHGEPAEALLTLVRKIVNENKSAPAEAIAAVRKLSEGLVSDEHLPSDLHLHILKQE